VFASSSKQALRRGEAINHAQTLHLFRHLPFVGKKLAGMFAVLRMFAWISA
jgi:hypothetical protein